MGTNLSKSHKKQLMIGHSKGRQTGLLTILLDPVYIGLQSKCENISPLIILHATPLAGIINKQNPRVNGYFPLHRIG